MEDFTPDNREESLWANIVLGQDNDIGDPECRLETILKAIWQSAPLSMEAHNRLENLLLAILNGDASTDIVPQNRLEQILVAKINGDSYTEEPQSRIEALLIEWLNAYIEKTVTGNPITVNDAVAQNVMALLAELVPAQDLHGYDNPWPGGGGKNVLPPPTSIEPAVSATITDNNGSLSITTTGAGQSVVYIPEFTFASGGQKIELLNSFTSGTIRFYHGETQVDYFSLSSVNRVIKASSLSVLQGQTIDNYRIQTNGAVTGTISLMVTPDSDANLSAFLPYSNICPITGRDSVSVERTDGDGNNPQSVTVQLGQTVYGGTVDVVTGELTIDRVKKTYTSSTLFASSNNAVYTNAYDFIKSDDYRGKIICDKLQTVVRNSSSMPIFSLSGYYDNGNAYPNQNWIYFRIAETMSTAIMQNWLDEVGGIEVCYELATPITVTLTPQTLAMLAGTNIIQSAEAADLSLTYKATPSADTPPLLGGFMPNPSPDPEPAEDLMEESLEEIPEDEPEEFTLITGEDYDGDNI